MRRLLSVLALLACFAPASTAWAAPAFRDSVQSPATAERAAEWGGPTVATDGETVNLFISDAYPADPALAKQWADFMTSLVHGPELQTVTIHLVTLAEVRRTCGSGALACYSSPLRRIVAPEVDPVDGTTAQGVLAHEYGHHVAASRANPPFESVDYGTKRWASYENVCARTRSGKLFPGAEDAQHYELNPGEAFAEAYRVLNEQKLGLTQESWDVVTESLYPDATALSLLEQDVVSPWTANTTRALSATVSGRARTKTLTLKVPYDGTLVVSPRQTGRGTVAVSLVTRGKTLATSGFRGASGRRLGATVCGQRTFALRVQLPQTAAKTARTTVTLTVSAP